jgi:hypothetical protein
MLARGRMNSIGQLGKGHVARASCAQRRCRLSEFGVLRRYRTLFSAVFGGKADMRDVVPTRRKRTSVANNRDFMSTRPHSDYGYLRGFSRRPA